MEKGSWTKYECECGNVLYSSFPYQTLTCDNCKCDVNKEEGRLYTAKEVHDDLFLD